MNKLDDPNHIKKLYREYMSNYVPHNFPQTSRDKFLKLYALKDKPQLFCLQNKIGIFFYNIILEKYKVVIGGENSVLKSRSVYSFKRQKCYDSEYIHKTYITMLDYYNNFIVPLLNSINPIGNFVFKKLPDNIHKIL